MDFQEQSLISVDDLILNTFITSFKNRYTKNLVNFFDATHIDEIGLELNNYLKQIIYEYMIKYKEFILPNLQHKIEHGYKSWTFYYTYFRNNPYYDRTLFHKGDFREKWMEIIPDYQGPCHSCILLINLMIKYQLLPSFLKFKITSYENKGYFRAEFWLDI